MTNNCQSCGKVEYPLMLWSNGAKPLRLCSSCWGDFARRDLIDKHERPIEERLRILRCDLRRLEYMRHCYQTGHISDYLAVMPAGEDVPCLPS